MANPFQTALRASDPTYLWKAILRLLAILLAIIGIATFAWSLTKQIRSPPIYEDYNYPYYGMAILPWAFIILGLSIIWNIVNLTVLSSQKKVMNSASSVVCDLVLWLGLLVMGSLATIGATAFFLNYPGEFDYGYNPGDSDEISSNSSGTYNATLPNQTITEDCGVFSSCAAEKQYNYDVQQKGIITAVGAAMSLVVLYVTPSSRAPGAKPSPH